MTGFMDLNEIYIRKLEDHNDEFEALLETVNTFCQSGIHVLLIVNLILNTYHLICFS